MHIDRRPFIFSVLFGAVLLAVLGGGERAAAENCAAVQCARADINHNNVVDGEDVGILLAEWNTNNAAADINLDGVVDGADLALVLASWGPCDVKAPTKSKIMFIRHAEKPACYNSQGLSVKSDEPCPTDSTHYDGVLAPGPENHESLVTLGWERAGGIAQLFSSLAGTVGYEDLAEPNHIYAADPGGTSDPISKRPYQTAQALSSKLGLTIKTTFSSSHYLLAVADAYNVACANSTNILISWQHEDILTSTLAHVGMAQHLCHLASQDPNVLGLPQHPWPGVPGVGQGDRYDMVLVFDLENGRITRFTQVPQLLLAADRSDPFH